MLSSWLKINWKYFDFKYFLSKPKYNAWSIFVLEVWIIKELIVCYVFPNLYFIL